MKKILFDYINKTKHALSNLNKSTVIFSISIIGALSVGILSGYVMFNDKNDTNNELIMKNLKGSNGKNYSNEVINKDVRWPSSDYLPHTKSHGYVSIVIYDIKNLHKESKEIILSMPREIMLCLNPLTDNFKECIGSYTSENFSMLIPMTLATSEIHLYGNSKYLLHQGMPKDEIERRFNILLKKYEGMNNIEGFLGLGGDLFYSDIKSVSYLISLCEKNNLNFVGKDLDETGKFRNTHKSKILNISHFCISSPQDPIETILKNTASLARMSGKALLVVNDHPKILYQVKRWIDKLKEDDISLLKIGEEIK